MTTLLPARRAWSAWASPFVIALFITTGAAASGLDDTTWNLSGNATARIGSLSQTVPVMGTLSLNSDRTYTFIDTDPSTPDESGVWFENRGRLLLFTQNLLEQLLALESALGTALGDTVRVSILKGSGKASLSATTGLFTLQFSNQMSAYFQNANVTLGVTTRALLTGSQAP